MSVTASGLWSSARRGWRCARGIPCGVAVGAVLLAVQVCGPSWCALVAAVVLSSWSVVRSRGARQDRWIATALAAQAVLHLVVAVGAGHGGALLATLHLGVALASVASARVGGGTIAACGVGHALSRWRVASTPAGVPESRTLRVGQGSTAALLSRTDASWLGSRAPPACALLT